jgi:hypothetical protein
MGPFGELVLKGKPQVKDSDPETAKLELLGQINTDEYQGISVLENKMYNAPVFFHQANRTDFFCCLVQNGSEADDKRIIIRELDSVYSVG